MVGGIAWASATAADKVEGASEVFKRRSGPAVAVGPAKDDPLREVGANTAEKLGRLPSAVRIWGGQF